VLERKQAPTLLQGDRGPTSERGSVLSTSLKTPGKDAYSPNPSARTEGHHGPRERQATPLSWNAEMNSRKTFGTGLVSSLSVRTQKVLGGQEGSPRSLLRYR
jgi:hypothetical protein